MNEDQKLVTIGQFESAFEAEQAKIALEDEGISTIVLGDNLGTSIPYSSRTDYVELQVFEKDQERAKQILAKIEEFCDGKEDEEEDL